jgi:hypothetical protein
MPFGVIFQKNFGKFLWEICADELEAKGQKVRNLETLRARNV